MTLKIIERNIYVNMVSMLTNIPTGYFVWNYILHYWHDWLIISFYWGDIQIPTKMIITGSRYSSTAEYMWEALVSILSPTKKKFNEILIASKGHISITIFPSSLCISYFSGVLFNKHTYKNGGNVLINMYIY